LATELLENDHAADSVRKFPALTAAEQVRQFLDKSELFTVFCTAMNFGERFGWGARRSIQSAKIARWEKA
jgi:hypothetical protein